MDGRELWEYEGITLEGFIYEMVDIYALCVEALACHECMGQKTISCNEDMFLSKMAILLQKDKIIIH